MGTDLIPHIVGNKPASFFLDSSQMARYSYAGLYPKSVLSGNDDPWPRLEAALQNFSLDLRCDFLSGGWVGFLAYEAYHFLDPYKKIKPQESLFPLYWFGFFESVLVLDTKEKKCFLASSFLNEKELSQQAGLWMEAYQACRHHEQSSVQKGSLIEKNPSQSFCKKVDLIKEYLKAGDVYQVNVTERFVAQTKANPCHVYEHLRRISPAPMSAFLNTGEFQVLSSSPESFLKIEGKNVDTSPIKGTRPRSLAVDEDEKLKAELKSSDKDAAELLMIVDLERSDLGKVCEYGSVTVSALDHVESFAQVHHRMAKVRGVLKENENPVSVLKALFPGGSVTGAPKKRAMEIINELEDVARSVYTGALGFMGPGLTHMNLPIRTMTMAGDKVYFHAGCGIVADSDSQKEYEEMMVKASGMMGALGIIG
ncbi:MAG: hypothetical protein A2048_00020 [Deltaproteobacteria bacterium GWA2_45_12]|nr:MAG: hypothetical protein A2048_00020 [Deltaproteobacteria bacterium GWA2_45_12]